MWIWRLGQRRVALLFVAGVLSAFYSIFAGFLVVTSIYRLTFLRDITAPKAVAAVHERPEDFESLATGLRGTSEISAGLILSATTAVLRVSCVLLPLVIFSSLFRPIATH